MKLARFKAGPDFIMVTDESGEASVKYSGWVRLTEYTDVEFTPLPATEVVDAQLKQIDAAEQELREKFQQKLNELANERAKLLSLTHEAQS